MKIKISTVCFLLLSMGYVCVSYAGSCESAVGSSDTLVDKRVNAESATNKSQKYSVENELKEQGHRDILVKGVDSAQQLVEFAKTLRNRKIDPEKTHIPELAEMAIKHIEFMKKGIEIAHHPSRENVKGKKLLVLDKLKQQTKEQEENQAMTYKWWLKLNHVLTNIIDLTQMLPKDQVRILQTIIGRDNYNIDRVPGLMFFDYFHINTKIDDIIMKFPEVIYLPTISHLGVMARNNAWASSVIPVQISNKLKNSIVIQDRVTSREIMGIGYVSSKGVFDFDTSTHIRSGGGKKYRLLYDKLYNEYKVTQIEALPKEDREMVEIIFYTLFVNITTEFLSFTLHAEGYKHKYRFPAFFVRDMVRYIIEHKKLFYVKYGDVSGEISGLLPDHIKRHSNEEIDNYLRQAVEVFLRATNL